MHELNNGNNGRIKCAVGDVGGGRETIKSNLVWPYLYEGVCSVS